MLVENPEILEKTLESFRSEHKRKSKSDIALRAGINQILIMLMNDKRDEEKIRKALLKIKPLEKRLRDKYRRFGEHCKEQQIIYFSSIDKTFLLSEIKEIWWQQLPPWPIEECSEEFPPSLLLCVEMVMEESIYLAKQ